MAWPSTPRRNRRNRTLPVPTIPTVAVQANVFEVSCDGTDNTLTFTFDRPMDTTTNVYPGQITQFHVMDGGPVRTLNWGDDTHASVEFIGNSGGPDGWDGFTIEVDGLSALRTPDGGYLAPGTFVIQPAP